jgi:hypothetical protein
MPIRDALRKAAGLFVEIDDKPGSATDDFFDSIDPSKSAAAAPKASPAPASEPASAPTMKTIEQIVKDAPGPNLDEIKVEPAKVQPTAPGGEVHFNEIYKQANLPPCPFTAEQALDMIAALPADLPIESKRATVRVTMGAMGQATGVNAETVVTDASRKLAALASYSDGLTKRTSDFVASTQLEISQLEAQITEKRNLIEDTKAMLDRAVKSCNAESDRLDDVLEFFSLDIGPSKLAQPGAKP